MSSEMDGPSPRQTPQSATTSHDRLDSWKEVAAYLKRDVTTVRRCERQFALPVRRLQRRKLGAVYAYQGEIDLGMRVRSGSGNVSSGLPQETGGREGLALAALCAGFTLAGASLLLSRSFQRGR